MRILLTGGSGFLGGNIIRETDSNTEIISVDSRTMTYTQDNLTVVTQDLTDRAGLFQVLERYHPDVIIHTAAISDIDYCETHRDMAEKVNIDVTMAIADYCTRHVTKMIHFSSDSVFDGKKGNYIEEDIPSPLHYYGETKLTGETIVSNGPERWNIVRPSLIMGLPIEDAGNSFLWRMIKEVKAGHTVSFPAEEIRTPVDAVTLSRAVLELAASEENGFFHLSGNTVVNRHEMALRICRSLGYNQELVEQKQPFISTGRAPRPLDVSLDNSKAEKYLRTPMRSLEDGLDLVISRKGGLQL